MSRNFAQPFTDSTKFLSKSIMRDGYFSLTVTTSSASYWLSTFTR